MSQQVTLQTSLLEDFGARLARMETFLGLSTASDGEAPQIEAHDDYVDEYLPPFVASCATLGDPVRKLGGLLKKAFTAHRALLLIASQCKRPQTIRPMEEADALRDNRSEFANHQNMVHEAAQALGWLAVERTPKPAVDSFVEGLDFWGNKIRVQYKASNNDHIMFVTTLKGLLIQLAQYIKVYHLVGVTWNAKGGDAVNFSPVATAPVVYAIDQSGGTPEGTKDTKALRKCLKRNTLAASPAPPTATSLSLAADKKSAAHVKAVKPAVCEERNGNWQIEHQTGPEPLTVSGINMRQQVYVFGCEGATILLEGKAKNIVLDSCKKTKLIFDNAVSSIEIVNCRGVQVQCKGVVPSVAIDKTDGCLVYVSWEGREVQFVTSKSSEMNVAFPEGAGSDDYVEKPIPEQFVHKITGDLTISSDVSDLYSN